MKLNPPASSSDIEVAREIARRLHQRRRREDRPANERPTAGRPAPGTPGPPAVFTPAWQPAAPAPGAPAASGAPPALDAPASPEPTPARPADEPAPPSWDAITIAPPDPEPERSPDDARAAEAIQEPDDALDALTAPVPDFGSDLEPTPEPAGPAALAGSELPPIGVEDRPEEPFDPRTAVPASFQEADAFGGSPEGSPFDGADAFTPPDLDEPEDPGEAPDGEPELDVPLAGPLPGAESPEEELFDESPGPSWGDLVESCMALAHARGALLADAAGELVAARGEWPDPGAEAIASRLVAMMDRTLRDAPTRSVSAPVGAQHLTAWRVPVEGRLLTVVFLADTQVRSEARPAIDAEVQRGTAA